MRNAKSIIFLILLSIMILGNPADAGHSYLTLFNIQYPNSPLGGNCDVCHDFTGRNDYSDDWALSGQDFTAVENLDSDGDGIINIDEIWAGTNPGVAEAYSYYLPYFIGHTNHWTGIGIRNYSPTSTATVTVFVYDSTGNVSESSTRSIVARGHDVFKVGDEQPEGWVRVSSTQPLVGLCFFSTTGTPNYMADIPFASVLFTLLIVPHIGQGPAYDTIIKVCNPNSSATTVTLTFVNQEGVDSELTSQLVAANGSWKYELKNSLDSSTANYGSLEISASNGNGLSAFALYTNLKKNGSYSYAGISAVVPPSLPSGSGD